jgi:hypothetical protein
VKRVCYDRRKYRLKWEKESNLHRHLFLSRNKIFNLKALWSSSRVSSGKFVRSD